MRDVLYASDGSGMDPVANRAREHSAPTKAARYERTREALLANHWQRSVKQEQVSEFVLNSQEPHESERLTASLLYY